MSQFFWTIYFNKPGQKIIIISIIIDFQGKFKSSVAKKQKKTKAQHWFNAEYIFNHFLFSLYDYIYSLIQFNAVTIIANTALLTLCLHLFPKE